VEVGLSPDDCVLDGDPAAYPKRGGGTPNFRPTSNCGQTDAWIKVPIGTELGLGLRDIVFDVDPATPRKKGHTHRHPIFGPCLLWPNAWMDEDRRRLVRKYISAQATLY